MTKEDIEIEACLYEDSCHNPSIQQHFADGAEWVLEQLKNIDELAINAKKQMIDKVCDILIDMLSDGMIETRDIGKVNTRIRKAMEE